MPDSFFYSPPRVVINQSLEEPLVIVDSKTDSSGSDNGATYYGTATILG